MSGKAQLSPLILAFCHPAHYIALIPIFKAAFLDAIYHKQYSPTIFISASLPQLILSRIIYMTLFVSMKHGLLTIITLYSTSFLTACTKKFLIHETKDMKMVILVKSNFKLCALISNNIG